MLEQSLAMSNFGADRVRCPVGGYRKFPPTGLDSWTIRTLAFDIHLPMTHVPDHEDDEDDAANAASNSMPDSIDSHPLLRRAIEGDDRCACSLLLS